MGVTQIKVAPKVPPMEVEEKKKKDNKESKESVVAQPTIWVPSEEIRVTPAVTNN